MSAYYEEFKIQDSMIDGLNTLLDKVHMLGYVWASDKSLPLSYLSTDLPEAFKELIGYIESGDCGWKGADADSCLSKVKEMKTQSTQFQEELRQAVKSIEESIKEEKTRRTHACIRAMENFTEADWILCAFENPDKWLRSK